MNTASDVLARLYPSLFTDVRCGVSIGLGWVPLVSELANEILNLGYRIRVDQVKEKFGGLRFYFTPEDDEKDTDILYALVDEFEKRAAETCEFCGAPGKLTSGGWIKTLCEEHATERERR